ncbi:MAG: hypothetical protein AB7T63_04580 [Planctomycetota bacterium]
MIEAGQARPHDLGTPPGVPHVRGHEFAVLAGRRLVCKGSVEALSLSHRFPLAA